VRHHCVCDDVSDMLVGRMIDFSWRSSSSLVRLVNHNQEVRDIWFKQGRLIEILDIRYTILKAIAHFHIFTIRKSSHNLFIRYI
jgi:hypothetical protein